MTTRGYKFTSTGLVRELADLIMADGRVPTHSDWAESLASVLVGMCAGKERFVVNDLGELYGNIFVIYIGGSAIAFKSVPLRKIVEPILKELTERVNVEICSEYGMRLDEFQKEWRDSNRATKAERKKEEWKQKRYRLDIINEKLVDFSIPSRFTSEWLASHLTEHPQGMIPSDEYTKMVKGASQKDYLADTMEDLSRLYDCAPEKVGTLSRGIEYPEDAYVSFVSATTYYLFTLMDDTFFIQGTGTRILWILDYERKKVNVEEEAGKMEFFWAVKDSKEFNQRLNNIINKLLIIRKLPEGQITLDFDGSTMLDKYRLEKYNEAVDLFTEDLLDKDANVVGRLAQNAMKLALIHCVGRYAADYDPNNPLTRGMEINKVDAEWAIAKTERHFEHYKRMWEIASRTMPTTTRMYKTDLERVIYIIRRLEGRGGKVTKTDIMQQTGWKAPDCEEILNLVLATKRIKTYIGRSGTRNVTYYTLP